MTAREARFRQAAWTYLAYGIVYLGGAIYLASLGIGARGMRVGAALVWFVLGVLFILVFPWLISRGTRGWGYLWFARVLTLLVAYRAFEVGRVALAPRVPSVPLPGGGEAPMALGAWAFFLVTVLTLAMLARAAWSRPE
jgi:hypothetical protein